jgi:hypothetical protein
MGCSGRPVPAWRSITLCDDRGGGSGGRAAPGRVRCRASRSAPDRRRSAPPGGSASGRQECPGSATTTRSRSFPPLWTWPPERCGSGGWASAAACQRRASWRSAPSGPVPKQPASAIRRIAALGAGQGASSHRAHRTSRPSAGRHRTSDMMATPSSRAAPRSRASARPTASRRRNRARPRRPGHPRHWPASAPIRLASTRPGPASRSATAQSPRSRAHGRAVGPHPPDSQNRCPPGHGHRLPPH